jgi:hypothetical protein
MGKSTVGRSPYVPIPLLEDESVVDEQYARYGDEWFRAGGKIFLTSKRLIFNPRRNFIGPSAEPKIIDLERIAVLGRRQRGWTTRLFIWGQNADAWFIDADGERHWFDLGFGWNKTWLEKLARRLGLSVTLTDDR